MFMIIFLRVYNYKTIFSIQEGGVHQSLCPLIKPDYAPVRPDIQAASRSTLFCKDCNHRGIIHRSLIFTNRSREIRKLDVGGSGAQRKGKGRRKKKEKEKKKESNISEQMCYQQKVGISIKQNILLLSYTVDITIYDIRGFVDNLQPMRACINCSQLFLYGLKRHFSGFQSCRQIHA